jgi:hypothetical protein
MQNTATYSKNSQPVRTLAELAKAKTAIDGQIASLYSSATALSQAERDQKAEGLKALKTQMEDYKVFKVNLSFVPGPEFATRMYDWVAAKVGAGVIVDFGFSPDLIAGLTVEWQGKYLDLSLERTLEEKYGL